MILKERTFQCEIIGFIRGNVPDSITDVMNSKTKLALDSNAKDLVNGKATVMSESRRVPVKRTTVGLFFEINHFPLKLESI